MTLIDSDVFLQYLIFSKHIDNLKCKEVREAVEMSKVDVFDKIIAEITDTGAYEQETMGKTAFLNGINYCLGVIDRYRGEDTTQKIINKSPIKRIKTIEEIEKEIEDGDVYTSEQFEKYVNSGVFIPSDGSGYYHDGVSETNISVWSSDKINTSYPYVCWYNK